jgi:hypothetical protein
MTPRTKDGGKTRMQPKSRVAVNHPELVERHVPGAEHVVGNGVAEFELGFAEPGQRMPVEPGHGQQPVGRQLGQGFGHMDAGFLCQHRRIEPHVPRLALVIQLLAQPFRDFRVDLRRRNRLVVALVDREHELELPQVGLHRRGHVGILQLAGELLPVHGDGPVHLAE